MFIRKNWLPLSVFLIAIVMVGLYVLQTRPEKGPIKIYKTTEVEKPKEKAPVGDTSQGGHFHDDGTWHDAPHPTPLETPQDPVDISALVQTPKSVWKQAYQKAKAKAKAEGRYSTIEDVVADAVPSEAELQAMSDEDLSKLHTESFEKMKSLFPEVKKSGDALVALEKAGERHRIYDLDDPVREARDAINYEFHVHSITASRVTVEQQRRSPPSTHYITDPEAFREVTKMLEETDVMDIYRQIENDISEGGKE